MRTESLECLRCRTRMEPGFVADGTESGYAQEKWSPGTPKVSRWTGLKVNKEETVPVITMRCPKCGGLESFAWPA